MPGGLVILCVGIVLGLGAVGYLSLSWMREKEGETFE